MMASTFSPTRHEFPEDLWPTEQSIGEEIRPVDLKGKPSLGKRASRRLARFLFVFCTGVTATLAWQSYGDTARAMIASSYPILDWLAPQGEALAQPGRDMLAAPASAIPSPNAQQLDAVSLALGVLRQRVDQLAAGQQRMAGDIAKLEAAEQDILNKISAPPPRPAAAPARKPVPLTPPPSAQAVPER
jgi:hypothetical protein